MKAQYFSLTCIGFISVFSLCVFPTSKAYACSGFLGRLDPTCKGGILDKGAIKDNINNAVNQTFKVSVKNNSKTTIWVAANAVIIPGGSFFTQGYWELTPGDTAYILNTPNRYIEFTAYNKNGNYWGNKNNQKKVAKDGEFRPFFQTDMGATHRSFTQSFD
jgi:hypothetical protein